MPDRVEVQDPVCAAGVTATNPTEVVLDGVVACQLVRVTVRIPPGHAGLTGLALGYGHQPVLPRTAGRFISGDDEIIVYDLTDYPPGPQWQAFLVNLDTQAHAWEIRTEVNELTAPLFAGPPVPVTPADIHQAASDLVGIG